MESFTHWLHSLHGLNFFFAISALVGGLIFIIRMLLQFVGLGIEVHDDVPVDVHHADPDAGFKVLSIHALTAFFMMFGLVGLALRLQSGAIAPVAVAGGFAAGAVAIVLLRYLFRLFGRIQSSGNITDKDYVGCSGEVYSSIPANGVGLAIVHVSGRLREKEARSADGAEIPTGTAIAVTAVVGNCLVVSRKN